MFFLEFYRVIVQALFNLTYIQSLFTIITEMNKTEQEIWSNQSENVDSNLKNMVKYLRIISFKLFQTNFNSNADNVCVYQSSIGISLFFLSSQNFGLLNRSMHRFKNDVEILLKLLVLYSIIFISR